MTYGSVQECIRLRRQEHYNHMLDSYIRICTVQWQQMTANTGQHHAQVLSYNAACNISRNIGSGRNAGASRRKLKNLQ